MSCRTFLKHPNHWNKPKAKLRTFVFLTENGLFVTYLGLCWLDMTKKPQEASSLVGQQAKPDLLWPRGWMVLWWLCCSCPYHRCGWQNVQRTRVHQPVHTRNEHGDCKQAPTCSHPQQTGPRSNWSKEICITSQVRRSQLCPWLPTAQDTAGEVGHRCCPGCPTI